MNAIAFVHEQMTAKKEVPKFKAGDNVTVNYKIVEGSKERIQSFKGDVIKRQGQGATSTFTVRTNTSVMPVYSLRPSAPESCKRTLMMSMGSSWR